MKKFFITVCLLAMTFSLFAQDRFKNRERGERGKDRAPRGDKPRGDKERGPRGGDKDRGDRMKRMRQMMQERWDKFKKENPEKFAELEKLKTENPAKYREEMRKMMSGHFKRKGMGRHGDHRGRLMDKIEKMDPKAFAELKELRSKDPEAFRKKMMELYKKAYGGKTHHSDHSRSYMEARKKIGSLKEKFANAESEEEKAEIKKELSTIIGKYVEEDIKRKKEYCKQMKERLDQINKYIEEAETNKDQLIEKKVEEILKRK